MVVRRQAVAVWAGRRVWYSYVTNCHDQLVAVGHAPVSGDVEYRWSSWRYVVAMAAIGFVGAAAGVTLARFVLPMLTGRPSSFGVAVGAFYVATYAFVFTFASWLLVSGLPAALKFGSEGIELAAARHDVLGVPYEAVSSARVRWWWPVAMLDVVVGSVDESRVMRFDRGGRRPSCKRKGDQLRFSMPIAGLRSSDLRSELRRRGLGE
ncbi:hypothetical protein [Actinoplanes regularis]|uniref:hypothetical protein n=1 Tax=Actinoplanes regularis TaxID=52697 RepID=UPI0024A24313|nr:hypothetical protein [Actinoplanes regularis]GLW35855.1 hypothetical protein Areg01_87900 [Actinoplanes regularis]